MPTATSVVLISTDQQVSSALKASFPDASKLDLSAAANLDEAMTLVRRNAPQVLLFDINGRPAAWFSPLYRLCLLRPRLRVLVRADCGCRRDLFMTLIAGAAGYLIKSELSPGGLADSILRAKTGGAVLSPGAMKLLADTFHSFRHVRVKGIALTTRELEMTGFLLTGLSDKEVAASVNCSTRTVSLHLQNLYHKLGVHNRHAAVVKIIELFGDAGPDW